jgi:hypothetical protein
MHWDVISKLLGGGRTRKQCRERYSEVLRKDKDIIAVEMEMAKNETSMGQL